MAQDPYCSDPMQQFDNSSCITTENGGIIACGFIDCDSHPLSNYEDNAEWTALIASDDVFPVYRTGGQYNGIELTIDERPFGLAPQNVTGGTHTATYYHKGIHLGTSGDRTNITAYNNLKNQPGVFYYYWVDAGLKLWISGNPVTVKPSVEYPQELDGVELWSVEVVWKDSDLVQTYDAPTITYED